MKRTPKLSVPATLSFVVVAAATLAAPWVACGGSTTSGGGATSSTTSESETEICVQGADAGPDTKCPNMPDPGMDCPPGCQVEVV